MAFLEVNSIHKRFGKNHVLKGVDFSLEKGKVLSIIGSSGSGKTTLLRCINFLEKADEGVITVDGETVFDAANTAKEKQAQRIEKQKKIGLVFQDFHLFPQYSVIDNITLAPREHAKERADYKKNKKEILAKIEKGEDFDELINSDAMFARKFDLTTDSKICDMLYEKFRKKE